MKAPAGHFGLDAIARDRKGINFNSIVTSSSVYRLTFSKVGDTCLFTGRYLKTVNHCRKGYKMINNEINGTVILEINLENAENLNQNRNTAKF